MLRAPATSTTALADELRRHVVLHADETPVAMLKAKHLRDGKTHRAYIWSYCTTSANPTQAVVFEFCETRSGENVRDFLKLSTPHAWQGTLVSDSFSGYSATTAMGVTSEQRRSIRQRKSRRVLAVFHRWLLAQRQLVPPGSATMKANGHDPCAYFKDVLERLPTHPASRIDELLPHRWAPAS